MKQLAFFITYQIPIYTDYIIFLTTCTPMKIYRYCRVTVGWGVGGFIFIREKWTGTAVITYCPFPQEKTLSMYFLSKVHVNGVSISSNIVLFFKRCNRDTFISFWHYFASLGVSLGKGFGGGSKWGLGGGVKLSFVSLSLTSGLTPFPYTHHRTELLATSTGLALGKKRDSLYICLSFISCF